MAVIERDPDIYGRARAISTDEEVMRIWQSVGLADRLQADMMPNRPVAFVDADGIAFIESALAGGAAGHPAQQFLYQPVVDEVLRHGVERFGTVEILLEHECLRVADTDDGVELLLVDHRGDELRRLRARYVIAADGGSSPTRGQLGVSYSGRTYEERWIVIDTEIIQEWAGHDLMRFHCDPARPMVDCPTPLGHHRWEFPVQDDEDEGELLTDTAIWTLLRRRGIGPDNVKILRAVCYSHHVRVADRWRVGRVFLAGDAAHAMPPWIGQGMGAGVRDVANLCWKIAAVLRGEAPDRLLDSYQAERKPHVTEVTRRAVLVGRVINERRRWLATARNRGLRALSRVPGLVTWAQRFWWIPEARYRDGFFVGDHRAAGRQLPQPRVRRADGTAVRLDDLLGGRWTLLHLGAPPAGTAAWTARGVPALDLAAPDVSGVLTAWMHRYQATAVIVRPDGFVYAATQSGRPLPAPPIPAHTTIGVSA